MFLVQVLLSAFGLDFGQRRHRRQQEPSWGNVRPLSELPSWARTTAAAPGSLPAAPAAPRPDLSDLSDPKAQMEAVALVTFETVPLLNRAEARLLYVLEDAVRLGGAGHRLMAQTSLGEIIQPSAEHANAEERRRAFASINSKRIDFGVFDRRGRLVVAIEYQGAGHYHQRSFMRDAVKREALRKAGVPYLEIPKDFVPGKVSAQVRELLAPEPGAPLVPRPSHRPSPGATRH